MPANGVSGGGGSLTLKHAAWSARGALHVLASVNNGASPDRWRVDHPNTMTQLGNHVRGSSILRYYHCFDALRVCVELSTPE